MRHLNFQSKGGFLYRRCYFMCSSFATEAFSPSSLFCVKTVQLAQKQSHVMTAYVTVCLNYVFIAKFMHISSIKTFQSMWYMWNFFHFLYSEVLSGQKKHNMQFSICLKVPLLTQRCQLLTCTYLPTRPRTSTHSSSAHRPVLSAYVPL